MHTFLKTGKARKCKEAPGHVKMHTYSPTGLNQKTDKSSGTGKNAYILESRKSQKIQKRLRDT